MSQPSTNGTSSKEFSDLRELLVGPELEQLAEVRERLDDPGKRSADLAEVLPEAIRNTKPRPLREALEPVFEKVLYNSVRRNPKDVADAIYPVIRPAIGASIVTAIRDFAEALNQVVEKSVSFRAIKWRIESLITGKPFSEILLARSLLYSVEQVFLIHRRSGILLQHVAAKGAVVKDADMVSGMLTAIRDFLSDSFSDGAQELETVDAGRFKLWLIYGPKVLLVGAVNGTAPAELRGVFRKALDGIEDALAPEIAAFKEDVGVFEAARPFLESCLLGHSAPGKRRKARLWPYLAGLATAAAVLVFFRMHANERWDRYFAALKRRPGIVITEIRSGGPGYEISGLKDPNAADPLAMLRSDGLDPHKVEFHWQPYYSLDPTFANLRQAQEDHDYIEQEIVRFDLGSSKLPVAEADQIDHLGSVVARYFRERPHSRIIVMGHTDEIGTAGANTKLSLDRAQRVVDSLQGPDTPASRFETSGVADTAPVKAGQSEWAVVSNRSVSFKVVDR